MTAFHRPDRRREPRADGGLPGAAALGPLALPGGARPKRTRVEGERSFARRGVAGLSNRDGRVLGRGRRVRSGCKRVAGEVA